MKCPMCKSEMEKGSLTGHGTRWRTGLVPFGWMPFQKTKDVAAYNCPKCGKIELTTEVSK